MLRKAEFINASDKYDYDYTIEAIETFLDRVEQKNYEWALSFLNKIVDDARLLDLNDYKVDNFEFDVNNLKRKSEELDRRISDAKYENFKLKYRKEFDENVNAILSMDNYRGCAYIAGSIAHLKAISKNDSCAKPYAEKIIEIHRQSDKDDKLIRATFKTELDAIKNERNNLKERKGLIKAQREQMREFVNKYGKSVYEFNLKKVAEGDIEGEALRYAKLERYWIRREIYKRTEEYVGKLVDMYDVHWGDNGSLNGIVRGEKGDKARVETIVAGGYNIQCEHYRVLVKPMKK